VRRCYIEALTLLGEIMFWVIGYLTIGLALWVYAMWGRDFVGFGPFIATLLLWPAILCRIAYLLWRLKK